MSSVLQSVEHLNEDDWKIRFEELVGGRQAQDIKREATRIDHSGFNVLLHNDLWICNILFRSVGQLAKSPEAGFLNV